MVHALRLMQVCYELSVFCVGGTFWHKMGLYVVDSQIVCGSQFCIKVTKLSLRELARWCTRKGFSKSELVLGFLRNVGCFALSFDAVMQSL